MPFNLADFCRELSKYLENEFDMEVIATQEDDGSFFLDIEFDGDDWYIGGSAMPGVVIKYAGEFNGFPMVEVGGNYINAAYKSVARYIACV